MNALMSWSSSHRLQLLLMLVLGVVIGFLLASISQTMRAPHTCPPAVVRRTRYDNVVSDCNDGLRYKRTRVPFLGHISLGSHSLLFVCQRTCRSSHIVRRAV